MCHTTVLPLLCHHVDSCTGHLTSMFDYHTLVPVHSPAYGTLSDYQFMRRHTSSDKRKEKARAAWGNSPSSLADIIQVFVNYTTGEQHLNKLFVAQHVGPMAASLYAAQAVGFKLCVSR